MQKYVLLVLVMLLVLGVLLTLLKALLSGRSQQVGHYYLRKSLFTPAERSFLGVLEPVLPPGVRVFGKVRLGDIFGVVKGLNASERQSARNKINQKHVDFLLVRATDLAPIAGIELDDSSHEEEDRQQRDAFVDSAFASASLPLLHVAVQKAYNPIEVKAKVASVLTAG